VREGDKLILVCGGDGTINEVINGIAPGDASLGILPGGTANIAAKELGLPHDPVQAAREFSTWRPRRIALGLARLSATPDPSGRGPLLQQAKGDGGETPPLQEHRRYFLSVAGVGFDAYVVHRLSPAFKLSAGVMAYIVEALRQTWRYPFPRFRCSADGREFHATFAVVHRTSRYAGWFHLAPNANLFEDKLSLCAFHSNRRSRYFVYAAAALARRHRRLHDVELVEDRKVECVAAEPGTRIYIELDGELAGRLPASFEVIPDALTLLVPDSVSPRT
jgi:diacylglycerol kinase family enzyme